jgi:hypothetical protein
MARKLPQDFLFPRAYFRGQARGVAPVPAYFFHQVEPNGFEALCAALSARGIRTLTFSELLDGADAAGDAVLLTFDDGWSSVWSMALPIARRHGVRLTLFATPDTTEHGAERRPGLADGIPVAELIARDRGERPLLTWGELRGLHESDVVEIQSHSSHHGVVFTADRLAGYVGDTPPDWQSGNTPLLSRRAGVDVPVLRPPPGTPLAEVGHALVAERRFIMDEAFESQCLARHAAGQAATASPGDRLPGRWESEAERDERFFDDLSRSRQRLERELPGCRARVLAPPWARMHPRLPRIARAAGYELLALGYPAQDGEMSTALPSTPRLYGEGVWTLVHGPLLGTPRWLATRRLSLDRRAAGAIP